MLTSKESDCELLDKLGLLRICKLHLLIKEGESEITFVEENEVDLRGCEEFQIWVSCVHQFFYAVKPLHELDE